MHHAISQAHFRVEYPAGLDPADPRLGGDRALASGLAMELGDEFGHGGGEELKVIGYGLLWKRNIWLSLGLYQ